MENKCSEPFENLKFSLSLMGIWTEKYSVRFSLRRIFFISFLTIFMLASILGFFHDYQSGELEIICSSMAVFLLSAFATYTLFMMQNNSDYQKWITGISHLVWVPKQIKQFEKLSSYQLKLNSHLPQGMFKTEKFLNNHPNMIVKKMYRSAITQIWPKLIFKWNKWVVITSTSLFTISMLLFVIGKEKEKDECIADPECRMVFMGYYYFPWDTDKYYWFANIETAFFGTCLSTISYYKDMYVASFICHLRGRFSVLCYKVKHLEEFARTAQDGQDLSSRIYGMLKQCIREHQDIIRGFRFLHKILSTLLFYMLIILTPVIVNTAIIAFQGKGLSSFSIFIYCAALYGCSHLFLVLWLSEQLSSESTKLAERIYFCNWYELEVKHQKILLMMLMKAQEPFVLSCGPLFRSNLTTFRKAMKAVYTLLSAFGKLSK